MTKKQNLHFVKRETTIIMSIKVADSLNAIQLWFYRSRDMNLHSYFLLWFVGMDIWNNILYFWNQWIKIMKIILNNWNNLEVVSHFLNLSYFSWLLVSVCVLIFSYRTINSGFNGNSLKMHETSYSAMYIFSIQQSIFVAYLLLLRPFQWF